MMVLEEDVKEVIIIPSEEGLLNSLRALPDSIVNETVAILFEGCAPPSISDGPAILTQQVQELGIAEVVAHIKDDTLKTSAVVFDLNQEAEISEIRIELEERIKALGLSQFLSTAPISLLKSYSQDVKYSDNDGKTKEDLEELLKEEILLRGTEAVLRFLSHKQLAEFYQGLYPDQKVKRYKPHTLLKRIVIGVFTPVSTTKETTITEKEQSVRGFTRENEVNSTALATEVTDDERDATFERDLREWLRSKGQKCDDDVASMVARMRRLLHQYGNVESVETLIGSPARPPSSVSTPKSEPSSRNSKRARETDAQPVSDKKKKKTT